ncbi:hypothetical protein AWB74_06899 [Caballeronia arvi]|uniref:Uncharacterized protein n=1 Tax=Caballeronia arvi TaxID=1777135 RepID=A0A158KUB9_9BURK|nr:hypothetical protein AWB74_06899 [Caballeronia arvi]
MRVHFDVVKRLFEKNFETKSGRDASTRLPSQIGT